MNKNAAKESSLCAFAQEIIPLFNCSASLDRFLYTVENLELDIRNLETRVQVIQREIETLIAEQ